MHLVQNYTKKDIPNSKRIICYKSCQLNLQLIKYSWWWCYSSMADFSLGFNTTLWIFYYFLLIFGRILWKHLYGIGLGEESDDKRPLGPFLVSFLFKVRVCWICCDKNTHIVSFLPKSGVFFFKCPQTEVLRKEDSNCESVHILKLGIWLSARFTSCCP